MSPLADWVIARRYGFGATRTPVRPPTWSCPPSPRPLREGIAEASRERRATGEPSLAGRTLRGAPPFLAFFVMTFALALLLGKGPDDPELRIVPFEPEEEVPAVVARAPEPEPPAPEIEEPPPEPPPPAAPEPEPPPEEPAPPPEPEPPPRAAPRPQIDHLARAAQPPPPPTRPEPRRVERRPPPALPAARPDLAIDRVAVADPSEQQSTRSERAAPRFAAARAALPRPSVAPVAPGPEIAAAPPPPTRSARRAPPPPRAEVRPAPRLALARAPVPAEPGETPPRPTRSRALPPATPPRRRSRAVGPITPAASGPSPPDPRPTRPTRGSAPARPSSPRRASARAGTGRDIPGVPLGSLAACVSDRQEVELVKRVVATVDDRKRCESDAGRYHFVETRNVNAFLMWIERAGSRRTGDRCAELTLALDCLAKQPPARSRR